MTNTIYIVTKNADFTEGRGPMLYHAAFRHHKDAVAYIMSKEGIFGTDQPVTPRTYNDGSESYNGYSIQPSVLIEEFDLEKVEEKKRKIEETKLEMERLQNELDALNKGIGNF